MSFLAAILLTLLIIILTSIGGLYLFYRHRFNYWKDKNVVYTKPSFPFGDTGELGIKTAFTKILKQLYGKHDGEPVVGFWILANPTLLIRDVEIVRDILVRDFQHFHDRGFHIDLSLDPLAGHLFALTGSEWKNLRIKMAPTFTSGKMKMMFPTFLEVAQRLNRILEVPAERNETLEFKDILARYTTDVISSCAFGLDISSLNDPDNDFRKNSKRLLNPTLKERVAGALIFGAPFVQKIFQIRLIPPSVAKFFYKAVKDTIDYREVNNIQRKDFMQLLIELKNNGYVRDGSTKKNDDGVANGDIQTFTVQQAAAQAFVFFFAGFETSSSTMQFALYELVVNPDVQEKARAEVDRVLEKYKGKLTYEALIEMEYLEKVVAETLRKYPAVPAIVRECTKDYYIPKTRTAIKKGLSVMISIDGIQYDPKHYPNPNKFDPERFSPEEKAKRDHYAYLPFGEGPRICIGLRFGLLQTKTGLAFLLSKYKFSASDKTKIPVVLDPKLDLLTPLGGMNLKISKRD